MTDSHKIIELEIDQLTLCRENPRIAEAIEDEDEILTTLLKDEKAIKLAEDIIKNGLNPSERMIVAKEEDGSYTVMEGNRRLAALKSLLHPERTKDKRLTKKLKKLVEEYGTERIPHKLEVVLCDEEEARLWMEKRHASDAEIGLRKWSAEQVERFRAQTGRKQRYPLAGVLIRYAKENRLLGDKQPAITTVDRFISNPLTRHYLGLKAPSSNTSTLRIVYPKEHFDNMLKRFFETMTEGEIDSRSDPEQVQMLVEKWARETGADAERQPEPWEWPQQPAPNAQTQPAPTGAEQQKETGGSKKSTSTSNDTQSGNSQTDLNQQDIQPRSRDGRSNRKKLIQNISNIPTANDHILNALRQELAKLDFREHPMAATCCVRMMVERALYRYLHDVKGYKKPPHGVGTLANKFFEKKNKLITEIEDKDVQAGLQNMRDQKYLLNRMNLGAHAMSKPEPDIILDTWKQVEPVVIWCIKQLQGMAKY